jgi:hypothetical protein
MRTTHHLHLTLRTYSESNTHTHWRDRQRRAKTQRAAAAHAILGHFFPYKPPDPEAGPLTITLCRVSPRQLDDDNIRGALKHVRDGIADALFKHDQGNGRRRWANDNRPCLTWQYAQEKGPHHAVRITLEPTP